MARDMFQDITPRSDAPHNAPDRSIRNIPINRERRSSSFEMREPPRRPRVAWNGRWLGILAVICVLIALVLLFLFLFRRTTVSVVPHVQTVTFDQSSTFTAYPAATAATGTLPYSVSTTDFDASQVVQSNGTQQVDTKATGNITVVNNYSASSVDLIKNTRFETPSGLIFRTPEAIVIPGKNGTTPGSVQVTVAADQSGEQYNIGPVSHFTVPGLQTSPAEYDGVYAYSTASTTGGFSGQQPSVAPGALQGAISSLRTQLAQQVHDAASAMNSTTTVVLPDLAQVSYQDLPNTAEAGGGVRVHESAHAIIPVFSQDTIASTIGQMVAADAQGNSLMLIPGTKLSAQAASSSAQLGQIPLTFTLSGSAELVWNVDTQALAQALAGRDEGAFQTIVSNFPGIETANAQVEPFWETKFPSNPADIHITVKVPAAAQ